MTSDNSPKSTNIIDILIVLARHKWFLLKVVFSITLVALIISLIWPETFKSSSTVLPPKEQQLIDGMVGGVLGDMVQPSAQTNKLDNEALLTLIRSRSVREKIIEEFDLQEEYGIEIHEALLDRVADNTNIEEIREGGFGFNPVIAIELSYTDRDPELAKDILDFYLATVDSIARTINQENIQERLDIIERRFDRNQEELTEAEDEFSEFQETYGVMQVHTQVEAMIEQLGDIRASLVETKMQADVLSQRVGPENTQLMNLRRQQQELQNEYDSMIQKSEDRMNPDDVFHPFLNMPELSLQYGRLQREVEVQNAIYEMIYPQFQQQLMLMEDESRNLQVMDEPNMPTYKESPQRAFIVIGGLLFALFVSFIVIYIKEILNEDNPDENGNRQKVNDFLAALKSKRDA